MLSKTNPQRKDLIKLPIAEDKTKRQSLLTTHIIPSDSGLCDNLKAGVAFTQAHQATEISFQLNLKLKK
ncbi:MAG: hypothetical protein KJ600_03485 [Nanoarchaeota archaeon]|nr:hypothetical protein [Nanoarchaeota archaeon]MBU1103590.1 hypothetical protein [Nanoarchaeota archaeon]